MHPCTPIWSRMLSTVLPPFALVALLTAGTVHGQGLTGALIGTARDEQGAVVTGARIAISSPGLMGGPQSVLTNDRGQFRFASLPPGLYTFAVELQGFMPYNEGEVRVGAGATIERTVVLSVNGVAESIVVEGAGSSIEARDPGLATRFRLEDISTIPTRRASMFDVVRATPGMSPTSPSNGTNTTVSAFGSGTNENQFLVDGTNFTCPCNGIARAEPGVDFIQEVQIQSAGASAEYGQMQGAVINVVLRQGGERFLSDLRTMHSPPGLASQPVIRPVTGSPIVQSGYERARYRDVATSLGGPLRRNRAWFFAGYQHLRDDDSQPGADPTQPRRYAQDKAYGKLTWRLAPGWQLMQSVHNEVWANPDQPTAVTPFEATLRRSTTVPAITFGQLTYSRSAKTVWDVRVGRFVFAQDIAPSTGDRTRTNVFDSVTGVSSGGPPNVTDLRIARTTAKATVTHYPGVLLGGDHQFKAGVQIERGGHHATNIIPTGIRHVESNRQPSQAVSSDPSHVGALCRRPLRHLSATPLPWATE
ncbi:MAG: TonB-dependent receptor [Vicinamibacterales bacterium]